VNHRAHRVAGVCTGTIAATYVYQETFGTVSSWNVDSFVTLGIVLAGSILGSLLPDIDHPNSRIGRKLPVVSRVVNKVFGHRGFTHTLLAQLLLVLSLFMLSGVVPRGITGYYLPFAFGLIVGYASHLLLDMLTVSGIPLLYPFITRPIRLARFKTGRDDLIVSLLMVGLTGSYLFLYL